LLDAFHGSGDAGLAVAGDGHRGDADDPQERGVVGVADVTVTVVPPVTATVPVSPAAVR
jgi:hypothetical protein